MKKYKHLYFPFPKHKERQIWTHLKK